MQTYLYRVCEHDEDGDPLDTGIVTAESAAALETLLRERLRTLFDEPDRLWVVRCYPMRPPARGAGLWSDSAAYVDLTLEPR